MTGMKEGAGEDPFADDDADAGASSNDQSDASDSSKATPQTDAEESEHRSTGHQESEFPYFLTRNKVREDRTNEHLYSLRDEYSAHEEKIHDEVEDIVDGDVYLTDLREAIVATADPEAIAEVLRDWGQGVK